jgi:hypothetical protein
MATGSRTLKLSILGDVSDLNKSLKTANKDVESFGSKVGDFGKKAGLALAAATAAAGAYAIKIGIDGVKAAIEDEAAQAKLATTLQNVTGATDATVKATEDYILATSLAFGITDTDLRPSLERLVRATGDVTQAQKIQTLAIDIAAGSGKSLEAVSNALGKAYEGSATSLGKLGVGLSSAQLKTMSFDDVTKNLSQTFGGQAAANANTYQGRIERLKVAFDETKETIGFALLPILQTLLNFITDNILPIFNKVSNALNGSNGLNTYFLDLGKTIKNIFLPIFDGLRKAFGYIGEAIADNKEAFLNFGKFIADYVAPVLGNVLGGALEVVGKIAAGVITIVAKVIDGFTILINGAISGINLLIRAYNAIPFLPNVNEIGGLSMKAPKIDTQAILGSGSTAAISGIGTSGSTISTAAAGSSGSSSAALTNIAKLQKDVDRNKAAADQLLIEAQAASLKAESFLPGANLEIFKELQSRGSIAPNAGGGGLQNIYNVTVNGALNSEQTSRQIIDILNQSQARGTLGASGLVGAVNF